LVKPVDKTQLLKRVADLLKQETLPVLREKPHMMAKLGIDAAQYDDLVQLFLTQVDATLPVLIVEQPNGENPISAHLGYLLKEMAESAAFLGAEQFLHLYERHKRNAALTGTHCQALQEALQELEVALRVSLAPSTGVPPSSAAA